MRSLALTLWRPSCTKGVAEVLLTERNQPVIGLQQICDDDIPVVIAIQVFHPENGVRFVLRQYGQNRAVLPEQKNRRKGNALRAAFRGLLR